ncbi:uncharacterized protein K452DRAFT_237315 [Aplosporella prunicola CBS 121167]|uniref:Enoyl reductase (ER) domain-containing protein n=1 Tax=Aplosporella prunicola CBS 121167 TaxID=1176127 RepID=A0A6A6AZY4_9PEZI|nr:uncharacterized protein K452DRAFT_237315 [Aplosporella prunicola CBS 121167]KAF2136525.1 hypothetical protein K452DRAFT_237315 [Aplosporella prunicola CBS 121167]
MMQTGTRTALVAEGAARYKLVNDAAMPLVKPDMVLCKVRAVALNPADWKMVDFSATPGAVGGNDFAGEVVETGSQVTRLKPGDRVCAMMFGLNPSDKTTGAFGTFAAATEDLACKIPDGMTFEEASTLGLAIGTAGSALYQSLGLPMPEAPAKKPITVLVSGGATATGTIAVQLLRASGLIPIVTCSPTHFDMLKRLGAAETFDYHSPTCGTEIRAYTNDQLAHVFDCVTEAATMKMCYEAIGSAGGKYVALDPFATHVQYTRRDVHADWLMIYSLFGKRVELAGVYGRAARRLDREFAARMFPLAERLLEEGRLAPHAAEVRVGGLDGVLDGIEELRWGKVRGRKLVYPIA